MTTGWKQKPRHAGPWGDGRPERPKPRWVGDGGNVPSIGGSGRALLRGLYSDKREQAWQQMCDRVSNRWRTHKP